MNFKNYSKDCMVMGFALFAMFFGAGNLIFPPFLGFDTSSKWFFGFIAYIITDIGLSLLAVLMIAKRGSTHGMTDVLGKKVSLLIVLANTLCLGPMIAIPRTAATTFEFSVRPLLPSWFNSWIASFIFFTFVAVLCLRRSKLMDIIGSVLSPIMVVALAILIIKGIIHPLGTPIECTNSLGGVFTEGIKAGYQTMDMMGSMIFSVTVLSTVVVKGYTEKKEQYKIISISGLISSAGLFAVYCGLAYLGATVSGVYGHTLTQAELLIAITKGLLGHGGVVLLGIIVAAACLTTAMGLVSASAEYFYVVLGKQKIRYQAFVIGICVMSFIISNVGLTNIISLAAPILDLIYPVLVVLTIMTIFSEKIKNINVYRMASLGAFMTSLLSVIENITGMTSLTAILPCASFGFSWVVPAVVMGVIGHFIPAKITEAEILGKGDGTFF